MGPTGPTGIPNIISSLVVMFSSPDVFGPLFSAILASFVGFGLRLFRASLARHIYTEPCRCAEMERRYHNVVYYQSPAEHH